MSSEDLKKSQRSIRKHLVAGLAVVILLAGGIGGWGATVPISGALIAPGQVVVESNVKKVQHPTGGVAEADVEVGFRGRQQTGQGIERRGGLGRLDARHF